MIQLHKKESCSGTSTSLHSFWWVFQLSRPTRPFQLLPTQKHFKYLNIRVWRLWKSRAHFKKKFYTPIHLKFSAYIPIWNTWKIKGNLMWSKFKLKLFPKLAGLLNFPLQSGVAILFFSLKTEVTSSLLLPFFTVLNSFKSYPFPNDHSLKHKLLTLSSLDASQYSLQSFHGTEI